MAISLVHINSPQGTSLDRGGDMLPGVFVAFPHADSALFELLGGVVVPALRDRVGGGGGRSLPWLPDHN